MATFRPGMRGGEKAMWLRQHRAEVAEYYERFGRDRAKEHYQLADETLNDILRDKGLASGMSDAERALAIAMSAIEIAREANRNNFKLETKFGLFQDAVTSGMVESFLKPLMSHVLGEKMPASLEEKPNCTLCLEEITESERKSKLKRN